MFKNVLVNTFCRYFLTDLVAFVLNEAECDSNDNNLQSVYIKIPPVIKIIF